MESVRNYKEDASGHLVASKRIKQGEIVLSLPPLVTGPGRGQPGICLGCSSRPDRSDLQPCAGCGWPLCQQSCRQFHSQEECDTLKSEKCDPKFFNDASNIFDFVLPYRVHITLKSDPKLAESLKNIDQEGILKACREKDEKSDRSIRERLTKLKVSNDDINRAVCLIERYNIPLEYGARGLYLDAMKIKHSCSPNTYYIGNSTGCCIYRAAVPISEGEVITTCRVPVDKCNYFRNKLLKDSGIKCDCARCTDSTELGTGFGSIICIKCKGLISSENPGDSSSQWKCGGCGAVKPGSECTGILESLQKSLEEIPKAPHLRDPPAIEKIISERPGDWSKIPDNSQLILDVRKLLSFTYQYHPQYYFPQLDFLQIKEQHCKIWLNLIDKLSPGWSYEKTLIRYEYGSCVSSKVQPMKEAGYDTAQVNQICNQTLEIIEDCIKMMIEEEDQSMCNALKQVKMVAIEDREAQKTRVYLYQGGDDDEEDW